MNERNSKKPNEKKGGSFSNKTAILNHLIEFHGILPPEAANPGRTHSLDHSPRHRKNNPLAIPLIKHVHKKAE